MPINRLYHTWFALIRQLRPKEHTTRLCNFWLIVGIYRSRAVHPSRIAGQIPSTAKQLSIVRRLERLLDNAAIRVHQWYAPVARALLLAGARHFCRCNTNALRRIRSEMNRNRACGL